MTRSPSFMMLLKPRAFVDMYVLQAMHFRIWKTGSMSAEQNFTCEESNLHGIAYMAQEGLLLLTAAEVPFRIFRF